MPTISTDLWLTACSISPAKFSDTNFQFEGTIHFCGEPSNSVRGTEETQARNWLARRRNGVYPRNGNSCRKTSRAICCMPSAIDQWKWLASDPARRRVGAIIQGNGSSAHIRRDTAFCME